jgi:hypothetical protein
MTSVGSAPPAFHTENAPFLPRTTARGEAFGLPDRSVDPDSAVEFVTLNDGSETLQMFRRREARVLVEERDGSFRRKRNRWLVLHLLLIEKSLSAHVVFPSQDSAETPVLDASPG